MVMFVPEIREVHVEPTTVCQAGCSMCARTVLGFNQHKRLNHELGLADFQRHLAPYHAQLTKVLFCGTLGDPAAAADLLSMADWLLPTTVTGMNTNGGLRDAAWWASLASITARNPLSYVVFSIDGLRHTNHLYRSGVPWDRVMANAATYIAAGGVAQWDMLVFEHNQSQVDEARELARGMGFRAFRTKVSSRWADHPLAPQRPPTTGAPPASPVALTCAAQRDAGLYLSAAGAWWPCCYWHDAVSRGKNIDTDPPPALNYVTDRGTRWSDLAQSIQSATPPSECAQSCGTTYRSGQWKTEEFFS